MRKHKNLAPSHIPLSAALLILTTYLGFSSFDAISRLLMLKDALPQAQVMTLVMAISLIPVLIAVHLRGEWRQLKPKAPLLVFGRSAIACVEVWLVFQTFQRLQLAESYTLFFTLPLWVLLLAALFLKERIRTVQKLALLIGFIGALIAVDPSLGGLSTGQLTGLAQAFCAALGVILMRHLGKTESSGAVLIAFFAGQILFNGLMMEGWHPISSTALLLIVLAGVVEGIAHVCLMLALQRAPAPLIAPFQYSQILWALIFGATLFGEAPTLHTLAGLALIGTAGVVLLRAR